MILKKGVLGLLFFLCVTYLPAQNLSPVESSSSVKFSIKNFGFSTTGSFSGIRGQIRFDISDPAQSFFDASISAATISTGNNTRDRHLRGGDYFDVEHFPAIRIKSSTVTSGKTAGSYILHGELTIKNTSRKIELPFTVQKSGSGYVFEGSFKLNRLDYSVGNSSISLSNTVEVFLHIAAK